MGDAGVTLRGWINIRGPSLRPVKLPDPKLSTPAVESQVLQHGRRLSTQELYGTSARTYERRRVSREPRGTWHFTHHLRLIISVIQDLKLSNCGNEVLK